MFERSHLGVLQVDLFSGDRSRSVSEQLVAAKLAARTHSKPRLFSDVIPPPMAMAVGDALEVEVIAAQTPGDFYFQDVRTGHPSHRASGWKWVGQLGVSRAVGGRWCSWSVGQFEWVGLDGGLFYPGISLLLQGM